MHKPEILKVLSALSLSVVLALWPGIECVAGPASPTGSGRETSVLTIKGYNFPGEIAGMSRGLAKEYEIPELGFTIRYESPDKAIWADIFVYDQKLGSSSAERAGDANDQLTLGIRAMENAVARGRYKSAPATVRSPGKVRSPRSISAPRPTADEWISSMPWPRIKPSLCSCGSPRLRAGTARLFRCRS
jgi:hypothetical protein